MWALCKKKNLCLSNAKLLHQIKARSLWSNTTSMIWHSLLVIRHYLLVLCWVGVGKLVEPIDHLLVSARGSYRPVSSRARKASVFQGMRIGQLFIFDLFFAVPDRIWKNNSFGNQRLTQIWMNMNMIWTIWIWFDSIKFHDYIHSHS